MQQCQASLAASSPSLGPPSAFASGLFSSEASGMSKAWGSANIVMASDGTPIMASSTTVRPKAKVIIMCLLLSMTKCMAGIALSMLHTFFILREIVRVSESV